MSDNATITIDLDRLPPGTKQVIERMAALLGWTIDDAARHLLIMGYVRTVLAEEGKTTDATGTNFGPVNVPGVWVASAGGGEVQTYNTCPTCGGIQWGAPVRSETFQCHPATRTDDQPGGKQMANISEGL